jgi:hypothetical protein
VAECQFIKRKELIKKLDPYPILNSSTTRPELEESESEEGTTNSEPSDSRKETSTGPQKPLPEKQEYWTLFITPQITN